jgi:hypothetical protein
MKFYYDVYSTEGAEKEPLSYRVIKDIKPDSLNFIYVQLTRIINTDSIWGFKFGPLGDSYNEKYNINYLQGHDK